MANPDVTPAAEGTPATADPVDTDAVDTDAVDTDAVDAYPETSPGRRSARAAWWSLLSIPVAYMLGYLVWSGVHGLLGHSSGASLAAGIPATLIMITPGVLALRYGLRARREGEPGGFTPAVLGAIVSGYPALAGVIALVEMLA